MCRAGFRTRPATRPWRLRATAPARSHSARANTVPVDLGQGRSWGASATPSGTQAHARQWLMAASMSMMWMAVMRGQRATMRSRKGGHDSAPTLWWATCRPPPTFLPTESGKLVVNGALRGGVVPRFAQGLASGPPANGCQVVNTKPCASGLSGKAAPSPSKTFTRAHTMVGSTAHPFSCKQAEAYTQAYPTLSMLPGICNAAGSPNRHSTSR